MMKPFLVAGAWRTALQLPFSNLYLVAASFISIPYRGGHGLEDEAGSISLSYGFLALQDDPGFKTKFAVQRSDHRLHGVLLVAHGMKQTFRPLRTTILSFLL
jgi:hypothetical protein